MYEIHPMPAQVNSVLLARMIQCGSSAIGHIVDHGAMEPEIVPRTPGTRVAGTAVTVRASTPDSTIGHYALKHIRPGDVLIMDRGQDLRIANWGAAASAGAAQAGMTALITNGACSDIPGAAVVGLPVWSRHISAITTKSRDLGGALNVPVSCGGVAVMPGDAVIADDDGIIVLRPYELESILNRVDKFIELRDRGLAELRANPRMRLPDFTGSTAKVEGSKQA